MQDSLKQVRMARRASYFGTVKRIQPPKTS